VGQAERPQAQVGGRVRDAAQEVLDRVDALLHGDLAHVELEEEKLKENSVNFLHFWFIPLYS
jgi:hypothetical protein